VLICYPASLLYLYSLPTLRSSDLFLALGIIINTGLSHSIFIATAGAPLGYPVSVGNAHPHHDIKLCVTRMVSTLVANWRCHGRHYYCLPSLDLAPLRIFARPAAPHP